MKRAVVNGVLTADFVRVSVHLWHSSKSTLPVPVRQFPFPLKSSIPTPFPGADAPPPCSKPPRLGSAAAICAPVWTGRR